MFSLLVKIPKTVFVFAVNKRTCRLWQRMDKVHYFSSCSPRYFCFEFFTRYQTTTLQVTLTYWAQTVKSLPCQMQSEWYREKPFNKIWYVYGFKWWRTGRPWKSVWKFSSFGDSMHESIEMIALRQLLKCISTHKFAFLIGPKLKEPLQSC